MEGSRWKRSRRRQVEPEEEEEEEADEEGEGRARGGDKWDRNGDGSSQQAGLTGPRCCM